MALFFWCAYTIAWLGPKVGTISNLDLPIAKYRLEAARLRVSAANLRELSLKYGPQTSDQNQFTGIHANQIEDTANFCDEIVEAFMKLRDAQAPLVVDRDFGSNEARGYVRMLAVETRNLFGQLLAGTLAKVASVALMKKITAGQVHNWARHGT